jgi:hypothetical protein
MELPSEGDIIEALSDGCADVAGAVVDVELLEQAAARSNSPTSEAPRRGIVLTIWSSGDRATSARATSESRRKGR